MPNFKIGDKVMVKATGRRAASPLFEEIGVVSFKFKGMIRVRYPSRDLDASFMSVDLEFARDYALEVLGEDYFA